MDKSDVKAGGLTLTALETARLELRGKRNSSVAVKCVDIRRYTSGEGGLLDGN